MTLLMSIKNFRFKAAAVTLSLCMSISAAAGGISTYAADSEKDYGVLLSWTDDESTTQTFNWTDEASAEEYVQIVSYEEYGKNGFANSKQFKAECSDISIEKTGDFWQFEATAEGLSPGTEYYYRVGKEGAWGKEAAFTTDNPDSNEACFAYLGDLQINSDMKTEFAAWQKLTEKMKKENPDLGMAVMGGDIVQSGISSEQFSEFRKVASPVFSGVQLFSTVGNHESNYPSGKPEMFTDFFAFPQNGPEGFKEEFYSYDYANCHIMVVNSWVYSGEQKLTDSDYERIKTWMKKDLASSDADWQIVVTHNPVYMVHNDSTSIAIKSAWEQIFLDYGVDLVFEGHQHVYSRSYPLTKGKTDYENGITYIMGVSGMKAYDSGDETFAEKSIYNTPNYEIVRSTADSLTVQCFDAEGNELDICSVNKRPCTGSLYTFDDVSADAWYKSAVDYVGNFGLFNGTSENTFSPDGNMTRAMFSVVLHRYADTPTAAFTGRFSDVPSQTWYTDAVEWASANSIVNGMGDGKFSPTKMITLEQMVTILYRYSGAEKTFIGGQLPTQYGTVSAWAEPAMTWAASAGLFNGIGGTLQAGSPASRAQVAAMMMNFNKL